jgi:hypothetical protein
MKNIAKKIELVANVSIIVAALAFTFVLAKRYFAPVLPLAAPQRAAANIPNGAKADFINVDWGKSDRTLLLVLQAGCHFCTESAPFYQRLARETAQKSGVHLVAVLPQDVAEGSKYLNSLGVPIEDVRQAQLDTLGVSGTPTLILIDGKGVVMKSWVGKLTGDREAEVLDQLHASM